MSHLSISEVTTYLRCPEMHYHRYVLRIPKPKPAGMVRGTIYDRITQEMYRRMLAGEPALVTDEIAQMAQAEMDALANETEFQDGESPEQVVQDVVTAALLYAEQGLPNVRVRSYQQRFEIEFTNKPWTFLGFMDLITANGAVIDNKVYSRTPTQADVDQDLQLTAYALGYKWLYGELPKELRFDCIILKKKPEFVSISTQRTEQDVNRFLRMLGQIGDLITAGVVFPNPMGWWCSEKQCQYWQECRERW